MRNTTHPIAESSPPSHSEEAGFTLVLLMASLAIMAIIIAAGAPTWRYIMQDDRELELYFRGNQIAQAIEEYQRKTGGALPPSMEVLVQRHFLRKLYKDPMTKTGKWRILHQGETLPGGAQPPRPGASPPPTGREPSPVVGPGGTSVGAVAGVVSTSTLSSLRLFNGRSRYDQWTFVAGQPRRLGRDSLSPVMPLPGGGPGGPGPGIAPGGPPVTLPKTPGL